MRLGVVSDVHGNHAALLAVLAGFESLNVGRVVCCGDLVGYSVQARQVIRTVRERSFECVLGNHDELLVSGRWRDSAPTLRKPLEVARDTLPSEYLGFLKSLPVRYRTRFGNQSLMIVHGNLDDPLNGYLYPEDIRKLELPDDIHSLIVGHTHLQFLVRAPNGRVINGGSCGLPRDGDPRAACAVIDLEAECVHHCRMIYDCTDVVHANNQTGVDSSINDRLLTGTWLMPHASWGFRDNPLLNVVAQHLECHEMRVVRNTGGLIAEFEVDHSHRAVIILVVLSDSRNSILMRSSPMYYKWWSLTGRKKPSFRAGEGHNCATIVESSAGIALESCVSPSMRGVTPKLLVRECVKLRDCFKTIWSEQ